MHMTEIWWLIKNKNVIGSGTYFVIDTKVYRQPVQRQINYHEGLQALCVYIHAAGWLGLRAKTTH